MNSLIYVSYGSGVHVDELVFSILCARRALGGVPSTRVIVYTDTPQPLAALPVLIEPLDRATLDEWAGPHRHIHRRKILAVRDALQKFGGRVIYCDADTYFIRDAAALFTAVRPGHTLMHLGEFRLRDRPVRELAEFVRSNPLRTQAGDAWPITSETAMFNAGVVGIHESDAALVDDVLHLSDQIFPVGGLTRADDQRRHADQFAFSVCLQMRSTLHQAHRAIYHYWSPAERAEFHPHLARVLHGSSAATPEEQLKELWRHRPGRTMRVRPFKSPVETGARAWLRNTVWSAAKRLGVLEPLKSVSARTGLRLR
jgi:hypothetical protein